MRTTITTLDAESKSVVEPAMRKQRRSFKDVANELLVRATGLGGTLVGDAQLAALA